MGRRRSSILVVVGWCDSQLRGGKGREGKGGEGGSDALKKSSTVESRFFYVNLRLVKL